jgi:hypothetical protein
MGGRLRYFLVILALGWLAFLPPFFTHGACDAEFQQERAEVASNHGAFASVALARSYWQSKAVPAFVLSSEQCNRLRLKFLDNCAPGPLVYAAVPVKNRTCRFYRDDSVTVQLGYDEHDQLQWVETDMKPSKSLTLPFVGTLYWAG